LAYYFEKNHPQKLNKLTHAVTSEPEARVQVEEALKAKEQDIEKLLKTIVSRIIGLAPEKIDATTNFEQYGIDSMAIVQLKNSLENDFGTLPDGLLFECPRISDLVAYFSEKSVPQPDRPLILSTIG
jgi:rhizoxin biosynthesis, polyketide synthase / nonribosomal peptide synthetase RhiB